MMKNTILLLCCLLFFQAKAQKIQTLTYFQNDTLKLDMDLYLPEKSTGKLPLMLFVHGGGFSIGKREDGHSICKYMAQNGYAAATISYTLYMKNKKFSCDGVLTEKVKAFQYAVNDLWLATAFFIANKGKYNIDESKIFISGSSAGGETVLHAAYWNRDVMKMYDVKLPEDFKYAGLVSGAGAIMDLNLITQKSIIPMMFFHGDADKTVPYGTAAHHFCPTNASGWLMLFGSYSIYNHAKNLNGSTAMFTFVNKGHEYSGAFFEWDQHEVLDFLNTALNGEKTQEHKVFEDAHQDVNVDMNRK